MITPEPTVTLSAGVLAAPAILIGFFLSGYLASRWLPSRQTIATSFIASSLLLFFAVLAGDFFQIALSREYLTVILGTAALGGWFLTGCRRLTASSLPRSVAWVHPRQWWREAWWLVPGLIAMTSLLAHLILEPLSGFDTLFRWDYLARVMASQQSLQHYPPVTADDFAVYPWCDGIPPLVPIMNLWLYLFTGSSAELIGSLRAAVEFGLTVVLVWQISRRLWGVAGAKVSILVLATSSLFLSSIAMGQETGLSGVAVLALAALLLDYREKPHAATAVWIGLAAGFAALCRDYNLLFLPAALALLAIARPRRAHWLLAAAIMAATVAPWYLRNAWITGSPLFPHTLGGLFKTNYAHLQTMTVVWDQWSWFAPHRSVFNLMSAALVGTGASLLAALPCLKPDRFERIVLATLIATASGLWLVSVSSTGGGWNYSLRVLGPALPLLAIAGGGATIHVRGRWAIIGAVFCVFLAVDAARRSWIFIIDPLAPVTPYTWQSWSHWDRFIRSYRNAPIWELLVSTANGEGIVVDHPNFFVFGRRNGGQMIPLFSPQVEALWRNNPPLTLADLQRTIRKQGIRFVVLSGGPHPDENFYKLAPGVMRLLASKPTVNAGGLWIYDMAFVEKTEPVR
jgi:hypothetical protein